MALSKEIDRAVGVLAYYLRQAREGKYEFNQDMEEEIRSALDDLVRAAIREARKGSPD